MSILFSKGISQNYNCKFSIFIIITLLFSLLKCFLRVGCLCIALLKTSFISILATFFGNFKAFLIHIITKMNQFVESSTTFTNLFTSRFLDFPKGFKNERPIYIPPSLTSDRSNSISLQRKLCDTKSEHCWGFKHLLEN